MANCINQFISNVRDLHTSQLAGNNVGSEKYEGIVKAKLNQKQNLGDLILHRSNILTPADFLHGTFK